MSFVVLYDTPRKPRPWWMAAGVTPIAAYQAKGAASLAASYINLVNPGTFNAAPGVAPTWAAATGWTFNGTTQYLAIGYIAATNNHTIMARFSNGDTTNTDRRIIGAQVGTAVQLLRNTNTTGGRVYRNGPTALSVAPAVASGTLCYAGNAAYLNGASDGTITDISTLSGVQFYIGAGNSSGVAAGFFSGDIIAAILFSSVVGASGVANLHAAMMLL